MTGFAHRGSLSGWVAFGGPLAFYIATLEPGVAFWDIGEMQTVPYVLGVSHPTGFPFFVLTGWLFGHLLPAGDPAWRISLMCALAMAASAWLLWSFVLDLTGSAAAGLGAALVFALGDVTWSHAVRAETHDVALACSTLALVAAYRAGSRREGRALAVSAAACGFGLATHPIVLFTIPAALVFAWPALAAASWPTRARIAAIALLPLALYLYIPLRSAYVEAYRLDPNVDLGLEGSAIFDDGMPSSPEKLRLYLSGNAYRPDAAAASMFSARGLARIWPYWSTIAAKEFGVVVIAFAALGAVSLAVQRRRAALGLATLGLASLAFAPNYSVEVDADRYALAVLWAIVACAAYGTFTLARAIVRERPAIAGALACATLLATLFGTAPQAYADTVKETAHEDASGIGAGVAAHSPDGALIIATWNFATPLLYDKYVTRTLGSRRIVCGWPPSLAHQLPEWRKRFGRLYVVVAAEYDVTDLGRTIFAQGRWQIAELR